MNRHITNVVARSSHVLRVDGMDCASCAATVTKAIGKLPGVQDLSVSFSRETMSLTLDKSITPLEQIESMVQKLGFRPQVITQPSPEPHAKPAEPNQLTYRVEGMDCASCAGTISTAIGKFSGVSGLGVSVGRETMTLTLDESATPRANVEEAVRKLGFRPLLLTEATLAEVVEHAPQVAEAENKPAPEKSLRWWMSRKVLHAGLSGILVGVAMLTEALAPDYGRYAFIIATLGSLYPFAMRAIAAARYGAPFTIQMLLTLAAVGALFIDEGAEAAIVVLFFAIGEVLEGLAAERARSGIKALGSLIPRVALVEEGSEIHEVQAASLRIGQIVVARPGERIPTDGVVVAGESSVDESPMTGESIPVPKVPDSRVFAGSINHDAPLRLRVDRSPSDNTIARIIAMVEDAQDSKAPTERFIDSFSRVYMPLIVAIAALVAVVPPLLAMGDWATWTYRALALLLIGCPCALVISVPAAIASSLAAGTRRGMLIKGGAVIELLSKTSKVAFDKTGTLTLGKPKVTDVIAADHDIAGLLTLANAIERESSHPLAEAIVRHASEMGVAHIVASAVRNVPGRGMEGNIAGRQVFIGAPRFAAMHGSISDDQRETIGRLEGGGKTVAVIVVDKAALGLIAMRDEARPDAAPGIAQLKALGIESIMLTGDNQKTGNAIGHQLGMTVHAELLPEDKVQRVRELSADDIVVMVGDGVNDAPALATASVGVAIGSGTDVAMEAADAALMRNRITDIAEMIRLSRATMSNIRQNVVIALGLKAVFLVTTVTGTTGLWIAVFADTGATVLVTLNAMRLLAFRPRKS